MPDQQQSPPSGGRYFPSMIYPCAKCKTARIMLIDRAVPMIFGSSTIVTYKCQECGAIEDFLED